MALSSGQHVIAFNSDDPSSNLAEAYNYCCVKIA